MIPINFTDYEAIEKVKHQLDCHEFLVDPDDTRALITRFEKLLFDYESSETDQQFCDDCGDPL